MTHFLEMVGRGVIKWLTYIGEVMLLLMETLRQMKRPPRWRLLFHEMAHLGVDTLPIASLTLLFTGMVMALQTADVFIEFGAQSTIGGVVAIAIGRELGPVLVGVVAAGRVGAAITAEISTMKVTEQIDALKVMATSPVGYLVVPRMLACMLMLPILTAFGDIIGVVGGWAVATIRSGISTFIYWHSIDIFVEMNDFTGGLIKAAVFGVIVSMLGCYFGLKTEGGAEGVGVATTRSVVSSIIMIFFANVFLSMAIYR